MKFISLPSLALSLLASDGLASALHDFSNVQCGQTGCHSSVGKKWPLDVRVEDPESVLWSCFLEFLEWTTAVEHVRSKSTAITQDQVDDDLRFRLQRATEFYEGDAGMVPEGEPNTETTNAGLLPDLNSPDVTYSEQPSTYSEQPSTYSAQPSTFSSPDPVNQIQSLGFSDIEALNLVEMSYKAQVTCSSAIITEMIWSVCKHGYQQFTMAHTVADSPRPKAVIKLWIQRAGIAGRFWRIVEDLADSYEAVYSRALQEAKKRRKAAKSILGKVSKFMWKPTTRVASQRQYGVDGNDPEGGASIGETPLVCSSLRATSKGWSRSKGASNDAKEASSGAKEVSSGAKEASSGAKETRVNRSPGAGSGEIAESKMPLGNGSERADMTEKSVGRERTAYQGREEGDETREPVGSTSLALVAPGKSYGNSREASRGDSREIFRGGSSEKPHENTDGAMSPFNSFKLASYLRAPKLGSLNFSFGSSPKKEKSGSLLGSKSNEARSDEYADHTYDGVALNQIATTRNPMGPSNPENRGSRENRGTEGFVELKDSRVRREGKHSKDG